ncbi:hypothetical protein Tco_0735367 [Tanacetum coccineum]
MLAPKCSIYNGRATFANSRDLKKAQSDKPCLYEIPYDTSDLANRFAPNREETMTLANESRSKLNKDYEHVENGIIELYFVRTEYQLADMFTKALPEDQFKYPVRRIGMRCLTLADLEVLTNKTA